MTYFGFLFRFLLIPIGVLTVWLWWNRDNPLPRKFRNWSMATAIAIHVVIAVTYTTPWDNYLVATSVWWYDTDLVTGITLGYVPIEEYTFFVLQTVLTGMWLFTLLRLFRPHYDSVSNKLHPAARWNSLALVALMWVASVIVLFSGWLPGTYMSLILSWALIPVMVQLAFGGDILWAYRRLVFWAIAVPSVYLNIADAIAISAGTWIISPDQTLGFAIGGILPIEEATFFIITNVLVVFGITLLTAQESHVRAAGFVPGIKHPQTSGVAGHD